MEANIYELRIKIITVSNANSLKLNKMKKWILLFIPTILVVNVFGQVFLGKETWLYKMKKTEYYTNEFKNPFDNGYMSSNNNPSKISIYCIEDGYWKFVGELENIYIAKGHEYRSSGSQYIYFKSGIRVAYGYSDNEPTEIIFDNKKWKVK